MLVEARRRGADRATIIEGPPAKGRTEAHHPAIATRLFADCATARSDGVGCPPVPAYGREFLGRAAGELQQLPTGATIEQMLADYQVMRDQARACSGHSER